MFFKFLAAVIIISSHFAQASGLIAVLKETDNSKQIVLADSEGQNVHPITTGSLWHLYPSLSRDGREVAYAEGAGADTLAIVIQNLKTGLTEQWTTQVGMNLHPDFSGDGKFLAFSGPLGQAGQAQIGIINIAQERSGKKFSTIRVDGKIRHVYKPRVEIIALPENSYFPKLSSDGQFVIFQRALGAFRQIVKYDLTEKKLTPLTPENQKSMSPSLSFDDKKIAYTTEVDSNWDVFIRDLDSEKVIRATTSKAQDFAPTLLSDGSLLFASDRAGSFGIYKIDAKDLGSETENAAAFLIPLEGSYYSPVSTGNLDITQEILPEMLSPSRSSFGAVKNGEKIFVVGGHQGHEHTYPPESFLNSVEYYDLNTRKWEQTNPRPVAAHGFGLASFNNYIYAFGGFAYSKENNPNWKSLDTIDRFDTRTRKWKTIGKMPRPRSSNVVAQLDGKVYLIGGWDSTPRFPNDLEGTFLAEIDVFDLKTETISTSPLRIPSPLRRAFSFVTTENSIILIGGLGKGSSHFELLDNVTEFIPSTGEWRELAPLPFATFAPAAGRIGQSLFVFGGMGKTSATDYQYVNHIFELSGNQWTHTGRFLQETKGFSQVVPLNSLTLGILGGHSYHNGTDAPVLTFESFSKSP